MSDILYIWREHAPGEKFGEFLIHIVEHGMAPVSDGEAWEFEFYNRVQEATHADLLRWARERFGISA